MKVEEKRQLQDHPKRQVSKKLELRDKTEKMKTWEFFNSRKFLRTERYELSEMTVEYLTQWIQQTQAKAPEQAFRT